MSLLFSPSYADVQLGTVQEVGHFCFYEVLLSQLMLTELDNCLVLAILFFKTIKLSLSYDYLIDY